MSNCDAYSASESECNDDDAETKENAYCIFLHIVEGIGLNYKEHIGDFSNYYAGSAAGNGEKIILSASLNGEKFEIEGHSTETATIFNSNCIWESKLDDIKRMKTDNRLVKLQCFVKTAHSSNTSRKAIGSLLLPIRGIPIVAALHSTQQLKLHWHKLSALSAEYRQHKPEMHLLLAIVKRELLANGQIEHLMGKKKEVAKNVLSPHTSETALMLQSQSNVYVQLLEQDGLIQVGNNPDIDCDIFNVSLTFKQVKNLAKLLEIERNYTNCKQSNSCAFQYEFLGSISNLEITLNAHDCYGVNEKITLSFKTSMKSLRLYFQRIFYIPINIYLNGIAIANYQFEFSKLLPDDLYFINNKTWLKNGSFHFDRLHKILSPRALKPSVDFIFSIQLLNSYAKPNNNEIMCLNETFTQYQTDGRSTNMISERLRKLNTAQATHLHRCLAIEQGMLCTRNLNNVLTYEKNVIKTNSEQSFRAGNGFEQRNDLHTKCNEDFTKEENIPNINSAKQHVVKQTNSIGINTENLKCTNIGIITENCIVKQKTIGVNTESQQVNGEELTMQIVQELEAWKEQQMQNFLQQLERKEMTYMADLDKKSLQQYAIQQARLDAKMAKCEELHEKLTKAQAELNANAVRNKESLSIAETVKRDIELNYEQKFQMLDTQMQHLKMEIQQKGNIFEIQNKEIAIRNTKLEHEKLELRKYIDHLEKQLADKEDVHLSANQLKNVLTDLRQTTERFTDMQKSKKYYKKQWAKATRELHTLQLNSLKEQKRHLQSNKTDQEFNICLDEILNEECDALRSDRSELKSIKNVLFNSSDTSSVFDD